ncbi:MAG: hypothetical protein AAF360_10560, partial [Pseudomonadota bacterium]
DVEMLYREDAQEHVFGDWSMALVGAEEDADIPLFSTKSALAEAAPWRPSAQQAELLAKMKEAVRLG